MQTLFYFPTKIRENLMKKILASLFFAALSAVSVSAQAEVYKFNYLSNDSLIFASGQLFTASNTNNVVNITGVVNGLFPITALLGVGLNGNQQTSPTGAFQFDNAILPGPSLSQNGILFSVASGVANAAVGSEWNLWGNGGTSGSLYAGIGAGNFGVSTNGTLNVSAVPEPETYAMLLAGLGLVGFVGRRARQNRHLA